MSYRTLLVHLDMGRTSRARIDFSLQLAASLDAHLVGWYSNYVSEPQSFYLKAELAEALAQIRTERQAAGKELRQYLEEGGRRQGVQVEWRSNDEHPNTALPLHARLAEMVLGGVTRTLLASMTVPVLFSH